MKKRIMNIFLALTILFFLAEYVFAFDLDMTVDDDIRTNYNSSKLIKDTSTEELESLPDLPDKLINSTTQNNSNKTTVTNTKTTNNLQNFKQITGTKIHKGTVFDVISLNNISDAQIKGTTVKFRIKAPLVKHKYAIPADTTFTGEIVNSHLPQLSCNGGLVSIKLYSMNYRGQTIPINGYITRADDKLIFLNNIKGERTFIKTSWQKGAWGRNMFHRMCDLSGQLITEKSTIILSPFPFLYGTLCAGANAVSAPICAFFSEGKHISIKTGSHFKIRLLEDAYIN